MSTESLATGCRRLRLQGGSPDSRRAGVGGGVEPPDTTRYMIIPLRGGRGETNQSINLPTASWKVSVQNLGLFSSKARFRHMFFRLVFSFWPVFYIYDNKTLGGREWETNQ